MVRLRLTYKKASWPTNNWRESRYTSAAHHTAGHATICQGIGEGVSGVASGQVETAKHIEFRNVATSSFARHLTCFCNHGSTMFL